MNLFSQPEFIGYKREEGRHVITVKLDGERYDFTNRRAQAAVARALTAVRSFRRDPRRTRLVLAGMRMAQ